MALRKLEDSTDHNDLDVFGIGWDVGSYVFLAKKTKEGERW